MSKTTEMTLTDFLLACIAEDEAAARAVPPLGHNYDMGGNRQDERIYVSRLKFSSADGAARSEQDEAATQHYATHDPARVLRQCQALRAVVERCADMLAWDGWEQNDGPFVAEDVLAALATIYADRPGAEAWRAEVEA